MKKTLLAIAFALTALCASAQTGDRVIFEIGGRPIYQSQFMKDFLQSIGQSPEAKPTACTYEKRKALEDYVQLYVNFQAKLADAYAMGLDTVQSLRDELAQYRKELAAPYLIDSATLQSMLREAYERNQYALHAAHILVPCTADATPADTLTAYRHAVELYNQALTTDDFFALSQKEMREQRLNDRDPEVRAKADQVDSREGDLGCFTVFDMIYPFEVAAYSMAPGEVKGPVRSRYGYHIIKLFDRYPFYGKVQLAHIWATANDPGAKGRIFSAYRNLQEGTDFGIAAKNNSDDRTTSQNGGIMPELACNQMPVEYVEQVSKGLQVGEYTEPFQSRYGWHIIKLLKKETQPDMESMIPYYRSRMTRGERSTRPQRIFVDQCKQRYSFVDFTKQKTSTKRNAPYAASLDDIRLQWNDTVFGGNFNYDSTLITDMRPLFQVGDRQYNQRQFARYMHKHRKPHKIGNLEAFLQERYNEYIDAMVLQYADSRLEQDNPEFGALMEEYLHGLMIFSYNEQMVWSPAVRDSVGFEQFYARESAKHNFDDTNDAVYFWNERAQVHIITVADSHCLAPEKALKIVNKCVDKGKDISDIRIALQAKVNKKKCTIDEAPVSTELVLIEKGNQTLLSNNEWRRGILSRPSEKGYQLLYVEQLLPPTLKSRAEARGYYLNDYQNYLEEENNRRLRQKYNVQIHQDVIDEITY